MWWAVYREIVNILQPRYRGGYRACTMGWMSQVSNLGRSKEYFSSPNRPCCLWGPPSLVFNGYPGPSPGIKRRWDEVDHSHPSSAESECSTFTPVTYPHGVDRGNVTFHLYLHLYFCELHDPCLHLGQNGDFLNVTAGGVYSYRSVLKG